MAYREKGLDFVRVLLNHQIVDSEILSQRLESIQGFDEKKALALRFVRSLTKQPKP